MKADPPDPRARSESPRTWLGLLGVVVIAVVVRLVAQGEMATAPATFAPIIDSEAYLLQGLRVAAGHDVVEGVYFQAPLYPLLLGSVLGLGGIEAPGADEASSVGALDPAVVERSLALGRMLNLLLGVLAAALVWRVGQTLFSPRVGVMAGVLAALYGPFVFYEGHLLKVSLSLVFLPWAVLAVGRAAQRASALSFVWCGVALALGGLVQGHLQPLAGVAAALVLLRPPRALDRAFGLRAAVAIIAGALLVAAPVITRNSLVQGELVLSTAQGGAALYLCNNPGNPRGVAEHSTRIRQVPRHERDDFHAETERLTGRVMTAGEISSYWADQALSWIRAEPGAWLATEGRKFLALVSRHESADNTGYFLGEQVSRVLRWTPARFGSVLPLAWGGILIVLLSLWRPSASRVVGGACRGRAAGRFALAAGLIAYAGVTLVFCITARYRMPMVPLLLVYAGVPLAALSDFIGRRRGWAVVVAVFAGWLLTLAAETSAGPFDAEELQRQQAVRYRNRGLVSFGRGDLPAARNDLEAALAAHAGGIRIQVDLARLALAEGSTGGDPSGGRESALSHLQRAVAMDSDDGATWADIGLLAYELDYGLAAYALDRAAEARAGGREVLQYLVLSLLALPDDDGRLEQAVARARQLTEAAPDDDDGHGLLALAHLRRGRESEARAALADYDRTAAAREARGQPRRLPDQPALRNLRDQP